MKMISIRATHNEASNEGMVYAPLNHAIFGAMQQIVIATTTDLRFGIRLHRKGIDIDLSVSSTSCARDELIIELAAKFKSLLDQHFSVIMMIHPDDNGMLLQPVLAS
ncbi:hypothetical protein HJC99_04625 [Candidatus Saccharibacteria bacterium]|nr:hypothetical protein [Candidatus Saccharibacteria bacterium]